MENKKKLSKEVGERLRHWRENYPTTDKNKLTQEELALMLGTFGQTVGTWERGEALPPSEYLPKLASIFNVTCDEILTGIPASYVKITNKMGLNKSAINAFCAWKKDIDNSVIGGTEADREKRIKERVDELSNALASQRMLHCLGEYLHTKPKKRGRFYATNSNTAEDDFIDVRCSPDSYASIVLGEIIAILTNERLGAYKLREYEPDEEMIRDVTAELKRSGRLIDGK